MTKNILLLLAVVMLTGTARADLTPLSFTGYTSNNNGNAQTLGYEFSFTQPVVITALSYFDAPNPTSSTGGDGLLSNHTVGIYNASGALLASVLIPAGTLTTLQDGFRCVTLTSPIQLSAGVNYYVGGTSGGTGGLDPYAQAATGVTTGPYLTYIASAQMADGTGNPLTFPGTTGQTTPGAGFYGGSFLYTTVPEPATWAFLLATAGCLWCLRSCRVFRALPLAGQRHEPRTT